MKNKKRIIFISYLVVLFMVAGISGALAYFTSIGTKTNNITFGDVDISLTEDKWDPDTIINVEPKQNIDKNPVIENLKSDAYVYLKVSVPKRNIRVVADDETVSEKSVQELFSYTVNTGWTLIDTDTTLTTDNVYVYAYTEGALQKGDKTSSLFDSVTYANVYEGDVTDTSVNIVVSSMAIQSNNITFTGESLTEKLAYGYNTYLKGE